MRTLTTEEIFMAVRWRLPNEQPQSEEWRSVPGYVGLSASSEGRVMSRGQIVTLRTDDHGYLLALGKAVHRLVAAAFLGPRAEGMHVNHISGIKTDNRISNLEYATARENIVHARIFNLVKPLNYVRPSAPSRQLVIELFQADQLASINSIAKGAGVSRERVRQIVTETFGGSAIRERMLARAANRAANKSANTEGSK